MPRSKGYLEDHPGTVYPTTHHHLVSASAPLQATPTMTRFVAGEIYQDGVGGCLGAATSRGIQLSCLANGHGIVLPSWLATYTNGRVQEFEGKDPESVFLEDLGSRPDMVLRAAANVGIVLEDDYPSLPNVPANTNTPLPPNVLVKSYEMRGLLWAPIYQTGAAKIAAVRDSLLRFQPVIFAMFVDTAFEQYDGSGIISSVNWNDDQGGGHMLCVLAADRPDAVDIGNWWNDPSQGIRWGRDDGTGLLSYDLFASDRVQAYAIKGVPPVRRAA